MITPEVKKEMLPYIICMIIGLIMFLVGIALSIHYIFIYPQNKGQTTGYITEYIPEESTSVVYEVNGKEYLKKYTVYSSNYYVGKEVKVLYNKTRPQDSMIASFRYLYLILVGIGIVFLGVSGIGLLIIYKKYCRI